MALPIITADQPLIVQAIITYIYADPGLGKTSMGFTGDKAISFDFDKGAHRTGELRRGAVVPVQQWSDVANITLQDSLCSAPVRKLHRARNHPLGAQPPCPVSPPQSNPLTPTS